MNNNFEKISTKESFENKKRKFFTNLGLTVRESLKMHKLHGLWEKDEKKESWRNVSEHCLVEAARVDVFSDLINLSEKTKEELRLAAALHDFYKKHEIDSIKKALDSNIDTWSAFNENQKQELQSMKRAGISENIIDIIQSIGIPKESLLLMTNILEKDEAISEKDVACLIMHYVDDYTKESDWVEPAKEGINDFDRRIIKNESNPNYTELNKEGTGWFHKDETPFQAQRRIGHMVQRKISELIKEKSGIDINPLNLPEFIDNEIKKKIESII